MSPRHDAFLTFKVLYSKLPCIVTSVHIISVKIRVVFSETLPVAYYMPHTDY